MKKLKVLNEGVGLYNPNDRAIAKVTVECKEREEAGDIVLRKDTRDIALGTPTNELWLLIEKCIITMKLMEESEFFLKLGTAGERKLVWCKITLESFQRAKDLWRLAADEKLAIATEYKAIGNEHFKENRYIMAAFMYSKSLKYLISGNDHKGALDLKLMCLNNMAACQLKLCQYEHCITNCTKILNREPKNVKALYRRGTAHLKLKNLEPAEVDFLKVKEIEPNNQSVIAQLKYLNETKHCSDKEYKETIKKMFN